MPVGHVRLSAHQITELRSLIDSPLSIEERKKEGRLFPTYPFLRILSDYVADCTSPTSLSCLSSRSQNLEVLAFFKVARPGRGKVERSTEARGTWPSGRLLSKLRPDR